MRARSLRGFPPSRDGVSVPRAPSKTRGKSNLFIPHHDDFPSHQKTVGRVVVQFGRGYFFKNPCARCGITTKADCKRVEFLKKKNFYLQCCFSFNKRKMKKTGDDGRKKDDQQKHPYNCSCSDCRRKKGGLPLLVDVIEKREASSRYQTNRYEPQPSTSSSSSTHQQQQSSRSNRNQMNCTYCEKTFEHRGDLNKHVRKHTGEKPYTCQTCNQKFSHASNLSRHQVMHSGVRPFICNTCNKSFNRKDKFDTHMKTKKHSG